jgi:hypothetical protein
MTFKINESIILQILWCVVIIKSPKCVLTKPSYALLNIAGSENKIL